MTASVDELNAGVDAAKKTIVKVIDALAPNRDYPFGVGNPHVKALQWLDSPTGRNTVLDEVRQILEAAETVRNKAKA